MKNIKKIWFVGALYLLGCYVLLADTVKSSDYQSSSKKTNLCAALEVVKDGEKLPVIMSGIYIAGSEMQLFYDPNMPLCQEDIQPSTWVELSSSINSYSSLRRFIKTDGRAYVTFKGTLIGPKVVSPDDPSIPPYASYANRVTGRRYGHLNGFRTEFIVDSVLEARAVPKTLPFAAIWQRPSRSTLIVQSSDLPRYPPMAHVAGISGEVEVEVKVRSGKVVSAEARSGDRLLAAEAISNIKSWTFAPQMADEIFTTKFIYVLERRTVKEGDSPKIELDLPFLVKVFYPSIDW